MSVYKILKTVILSIILLLCTSQLLTAQDYNKAIGLRLGTYVGASFTAYTSEHKSVEAIAGITRQANQTDYLFGAFYKYHFVVSSDIPTLNWFSGVGAFLFLEEESSSNKLNVAPSAVIGMEYTLEHTPVNFFIDVSPHWNITTNTDSKFNIHANLGVRYVLSQKE
jgi:hypothetical protein